jgi:hypothetical protein
MTLCGLLISNLFNIGLLRRYSAVHQKVVSARQGYRNPMYEICAGEGGMLPSGLKLMK